MCYSQNFKNNKSKGNQINYPYFVIFAHIMYKDILEKIRINKNNSYEK